MDFGIWSVIPPVLTLVIALVYRNIIVALLFGLFTSSMVVHGFGFFFPIEEYLMKGLGGHTNIFVLLLLFGPFLAAIKKSGAFAAFANLVEKKAKNAKSAKMVTFVLALLSFHQTIGTIGIGSILRPVTDKYKVSREKLGFILSSTAPAMCALVPFTIFIIFYSGVINAANPNLNGYSEYIKAIPYNFYAILSVIVAFLFASEILPDFGYMKKCEIRVKETSQVVRPNSNPIGTKEIDEMKPVEGIKPDILCFALPFGAFIFYAVFTLVQTKMIQLTAAIMLGFTVALLYPIARKYYKFKDVPDIVFTGMKSMAPILAILFFAFSFAEAVKDMGFAPYVVRSTQGFLSGELVPALSFLIVGITAFATGSLVSGLVILTPIAISLATGLGANLTLTIAACLGGAMFGDQCSPLSDIVIEASMGAGVDVSDLARAQILYKGGFFVLAFLMYIIGGYVL